MALLDVCCVDEVTGGRYGWGPVLDYIGVAWEDYPAVIYDFPEYMP
ncbi:hypothetical protein [Lacrimispora sp.]|nr:hypothetical protein [Lacrimispora sp.]MDR7813583.1 hypothetical protein [Lacrimispora sp.]